MKRLYVPVMLAICLIGIDPTRRQNVRADSLVSQTLSVCDCGASGSSFETNAETTAGSKQITVADVGDFAVGQGVMISKCGIRYSHRSLWGPRDQYAAHRPLAGEVEARGYDGTSGSWVTYILDVPPDPSGTFRWTDDFGTTWKDALPITYDWQPLSGGIEVRFRKFDWQDGYTAVVSGRDQLLTSIEKIEGRVVTLRDAPNRTVADAVVRHNDTEAMQAAVDRAIKEKKNVFVPVGRYRLSGPIIVKDAAAIVIEGASAVDTVLDISEGEGECLRLSGGIDVTVRNVSMVGHTGFEDRAKAGYLQTLGGLGLWGMFFKDCKALSISGTERVLVENCHARRMSFECFYSQGPGRRGRSEDKGYTKAITYLRCSVEDCARNAFNNNDEAENTSILQCRICDVGGCSWEGASRFVRFLGNYVRNGGTVAMGNIRSREQHLEQLGSGQHIIADNVFEGTCPYGGCMIRAQGGAAQVIIRNNLFVNFNASAIEINGGTQRNDLPASNAVVTGNILDMTAVGDKPSSRIAIDVSASDVSVSDNQVYVRGACDPLLTGIRLQDGALNLNVHDNLLRHCGTAIATSRNRGRIGNVLDPATFLRQEGGYFPALERRDSHRYRDWNLVWLDGDRTAGVSIIERLDPETCQFTLREPRDMKAGDTFEVFPCSGANWNIHDNTITACLKPLMLDSYGSESSVVKDNLVSRGDASGAKTAVEVRGQFQIIGNRLSGFDEDGAVGMAFVGDALGRVRKGVCRDNAVERCSRVFSESEKGLWESVTHSPTGP